MNLADLYNELFNCSKSYNKLLVSEQNERNRFSNIEDYLKNNREDIEHFDLKDDISKMIQNGDVSVEKIKNLIAEKREAEKEEERRRKREAERERRRLAEEARRRQEEEERRKRELEEEQRRLEERRKKIIKWALIAAGIIAALLIIFKVIIPWIKDNVGWTILIVVVVGIILYKIFE